MTEDSGHDVSSKAAVMLEDLNSEPSVCVYIKINKVLMQVYAVSLRMVHICRFLPILQEQSFKLNNQTKHRDCI